METLNNNNSLFVDVYKEINGNGTIEFPFNKLPKKLKAVKLKL
jgi:hypothetical protein